MRLERGLALRHEQGVQVVFLLLFLVLLLCLQLLLRFAAIHVNRNVLLDVVIVVDQVLEIEHALVVQVEVERALQLSQGYDIPASARGYCLNYNLARVCDVLLAGLVHGGTKPDGNPSSEKMHIEYPCTANLV